VRKFETLYKHTANEGTQEWEIRVEAGRGGAGVMITTYGLKGGKKQESREVISVGKNVGKKNETSPYEQACAEALARWYKQKDRKGYGLTVEESADIRSVSPMLAHTYDKHAKKVDWGTAFAQPKLDGFRCLAHIGQDKKVKLLSRENQPLLALSDLRGTIAELAKGMKLLGEQDQTVILDGELYCHGMSLNQISSACKKKSDLTKKIQYHVYDCVMGEADFKTRSLFVGDFVQAAGSDLLVPVETVKVRSEADLMHSQKHFMDEGFEGDSSSYGSGSDGLHSLGVDAGATAVGEVELYTPTEPIGYFRHCSGIHPHYLCRLLFDPIGQHCPCRSVGRSHRTSQQVRSGPGDGIGHLRRSSHSHPYRPHSSRHFRYRSPSGRYPLPIPLIPPLPSILRLRYDPSNFRCRPQ
jgi:hypothetical protein